MTSTQQRTQLQHQIWQIANEVRDSVGGWDFKQYVLGALFYRFISENFAIYIEGGDESVNCASLGDDVITDLATIFSDIEASAKKIDKLRTEIEA